MDLIRTLLLKYPSHIKYGLMIFVIFLMIIAVKNYLNYDNILFEIDEVKKNTNRVQQQIVYTENFLVPYLNSSYADYFLAHENSILYKWEEVIKFEFVEKIINGENQVTSWSGPKESWNNQTPSQSRNQFLQQVWARMK